jgi:TolB-like protein/DNA-binding winged helix-turn-helix (wHTH) protein
MALAFPSPRSIRYRLGDFEFDLASGELRREGKVARLKPQPCRVLAILAEHAGEVVTREQLQHEVWGAETFVDFELGLNSCIKQIRAALGDDADSPSFIETLPRRGYRCMAPVERIDEIVVAAPEAVITQPVEPISVTQPKPRSYRWLAIAGTLLVLGLALVFAGARRWRPSAPASAPVRHRLAVLPFANMNGDKSEDFFGDGLSEEMITKLGELAPQHLGVIARTSAARYRGTAKNAKEIGSELGVDYILEGGVRRDAGHVHITAQLIQVSDQTQVWAGAFDRDPSDVFAIQSAIAQQIAHALAIELLPARESLVMRPATLNPEAHEAYLRGRYSINQMNVPGFQQAVKYFEQAIARDPDFASAYAGLADSYSLQPWWSAMSPREAFPRAKVAAQRALELDEGSAEAHNAMGFILLNYEWDFPAAEREFEKAITLNPGLALAYYWHAEMLSAVGRHDESIAAIQRAEELDPLSPLITSDAGFYYFYARRYDEAIRQCQRTLEILPNFGYAQGCIEESHLMEGNWAAALADTLKMKAAHNLPQLPPKESESPDAKSQLLQIVRNDFQKVKEIERKKTRYVSPYYLSQFHVELGDNEAAIDELERGFELRDTAMIHMKEDPRFDPLRSNPRFAALVQKMNFPATSPATQR